MSLYISRPGLLTTVQDLGRVGYQKDGIVVSGAMDATALRVANLLVGNADHTAGLEITLLGPRIRFDTNQLIALTGAMLTPALNGQPVGLHRPVWVPAGTELSFGAPVAGSRAYLAVSGGFALAPVLGSQSTFLRAGFGGLHGRALQAGDHLPTHPPTAAGQRILQNLVRNTTPAAWTAARWTPGPTLAPTPRPNPVVRAIAGPEYEQFSPENQAAFWSQPFSLSPESDRMGYRLRGPMLERTTHAELLSSAVTFGTVQVPADGHPIVLMADHQTTGGYPRLAQVATADFSVLAQLRPGQAVRFQRVSLAEAQALYLAQERGLAGLRQGIALTLGK
jgi:antagonist of KipI